MAWTTPPTYTASVISVATANAQWRDNLNMLTRELAATSAAGSVNVTSAGALLLSFSAITFGGETIVIEFQADALLRGTTWISLRAYEGTDTVFTNQTLVGYLLYSESASWVPAGSAFIRITPSVGAHTYRIWGLTDAGTGIVGSGGSSMYARIVRVAP